MKMMQYLLASMTAAAALAAHSADQQQDAEQRLQAAQERLEAAAREVAELSIAAGDHGRHFARVVHVGGDGPMLGINIDSADQRGGAARDGVRIISVSPGGPGAAAGLAAGDVITSFNGKPLKSAGEQPASQQLVAAIAATKPGESVPIEYQRDGSTIKTTIKPAQLPPEIRHSVRIDGMPDSPELRGLRDLGGQLPGRMFAFAHRDSSGFGSAELVELSPVLGKYFGTDHGLLVVRAPKDAQLKLQDGDVLLDVDGRVPTGVGHAYQILNSYQPGESLKLHIMRQQKRAELQIVIPAGKT
jgi:membrane-associated protease RseP (regulator of RpoE activity)